jgi:phosphatidylinositol alpha-1,6-mannosyltransferase
MKKRIRDDYATESIVVPNGIELGIFDSATTKEEARKRLQLEPEASVIISIGNLRAVKGIEYLIRAVNAIQQKESSIRLLIVGKGEEEAKLRVLAEKMSVKERIIFVGGIPHHAVPQYLRGFLS